MARKLRYQPENVCYHVVTRIAHREFIFDDAEKDIVVEFIRGVEKFTGVIVLAYAVMTNHLHLLLFIEKPTKLMEWEDVETPNQEGGSILERYELTVDELKNRMRAVMRPAAFDQLMEKWTKLDAAQLEEEYARQCVRMYDLSAFMKILKQNISQYYNARHGHTGALWEGRFKDSILERSIEAMSSVATYIDLNAWRAKMVANPADYKWCSWNAALAGDETRRAGYNFIYDTASPWETIAEIHQQQLEHRMAKDTVSQAEKEEAVFTSGAIIGSDTFIRKVVADEEAAFPRGHKSPPTAFSVGDTKLSTLRNLGILRGGAHAK